MPELPEVETVRLGLVPALEGARIVRVEQRRPDLRFPFPEDFVAALEGRRIESLGRRAKYLLADLDDGTVLVMHLGMSGRFLAETGDQVQKPGAMHHQTGGTLLHDHVVFHLERQDGPARVTYNDPRRFGFMTLVARAGLDAHKLFARLGVEPVGNALDADWLATRFAGKAAPLKAALLDQTIIAGLGNIYVCEALWRARLSPRRAAGTLVRRNGAPTVRLVRLVEAVRAVIAEAITAGGSSLRDYVHADGSLGYFQHAFSVYDREAEPCPAPGCRSVVRRIVQSGRSTFFCPSCQR
jgi:formamidopyrimidine-DNA glycosylase